MTNLKDSKEAIIKVCLVSFSLLILLLWAWQEPLLSCPDERMRFDIVKYIFNYGHLPLADEPSLRDVNYGICYATSPPLPFLIGVIFMKITSFFTQNDAAILFSARFVSFFAGLGFFILCVKIADLLFQDKTGKWCFICFCLFWPQVIFIFTYFNCDSIALFATAVVFYFLLKGIQSHWDIRSCIGIGIGASLCILSYYNTAGFLLCAAIIYGAINFYQKNPRKTVLRGLGLIFGIVLLLSGWFFIRNGILYHGDFLGLQTNTLLGETYGASGYTPTVRRENALAIMGTASGLLYWFIVSGKSFIGMFGHMDILIKTWIYLLYYAFIGVSALGVVHLVWHKIKAKSIYNEKNIVAVGMFLGAVFTVGLSFYYSLSDFQAQGRYLMPAFLFVAWFMASGLSEIDNYLKKIHIRVLPIVAFTTCFALLTCFLQIAATY